MASGFNLFVAPLDKRIDDVYLKNEFQKFGDIFSACVAKDENGESKGFGFVHFCSTADGTRAMEEMQGIMLLGRRVNVRPANNQKIMDDGKFYDNSRNSMWANEWSSSRSTYKDDASCTDCYSQISDCTDDLDGVRKGDVRERMRKLFETQSFTDVTFYPKNNRKVSISAHKAVLAIGSPLFTKMLFTDHNKDTAGMKIEVQISNLPFDAFTNIVKYLYTDEVFFENDSLVQGIFEGAKQFGIPQLVDRCKRYFESLELTSENVCSKLQLSTSNKIDVLKERCIEFIQRNTHQVINSTDFLRCSSSTIRTICKFQSFSIRSEMELLEAVMSWLYEQPPQNRKQLLEPILKCIRFLTFTVTELGDALKKYPSLLTADEGLSIMLYLYNPSRGPDFSSLPSWCNKSTTKRCYLLENPHDVNTGSNAERIITGKVMFPLKPDNEQSSVAELTSLLQLRCVSGMHAIRAIKLAFGKPLSDRSVIHSLSISTRSHTSGFNAQENIQIHNSENVRIEFARPILIRRGETFDIEAEAKDIKCYRFLQFDDSYQVPLNPHFQCCVSSRPKLGKLYFIREIEYGPQDRNKNIANSNARRRGRRK